MHLSLFLIALFVGNAYATPAPAKRLDADTLVDFEFVADCKEIKKKGPYYPQLRYRIKYRIGEKRFTGILALIRNMIHDCEEAKAYAKKYINWQAMSENFLSVQNEDISMTIEDGVPTCTVPIYNMYHDENNNIVRLDRKKKIVGCP